MNKEKFFILIVLAVSLGLIAGEVKQFQIWSQVNWIVCYWGWYADACNLAGTNMQDILASAGNVGWATILLHTIRATLVLPVFTLAETTGSPPDHVFSYWVMALVFLAAWILSKVVGLSVSVDRANREQSRPVFCGLILFLFVATSMLMNGRLIYGFLAVALLLYAYASRMLVTRVGTMTLVLAAVYLSLASSMSMVIVLTSLLLWLLKEACLGRTRISAFPAVVLAALLASFLLLPVYKMYQQYDYSFVITANTIFQHGSGGLVVNAGMGVITVALAGACLWSTYECWTFFRSDESSYARMITVVCIFLGFLGYAAYAVAIVPATALVFSNKRFMAVTSTVFKSYYRPAGTY